MTDAQFLERIRELLRVLLAHKPLGEGPIRLEAWGDVRWTEAQRGAYEELRKLAGLSDPEGEQSS